MSSSLWLTITFYTEIYGFVFSVIFHSILIFLVAEKTKQQFGNYKYLMIIFSVFGCFYSFCNLINFPKIHLTETSFILFVLLDTFPFSKAIAEVTITIYCSCYAMLIGLLATQFFYRYVSVTHPMRLKMFSGGKLVGWILLILLYSMAWGGISYFLDGPTDSKEKELNVKLKESYGMEKGSYAYIGPQYFILDAFGHRTYHLPSCIGILLLCLLLTFSISSVIFFGFSTYRQLTGLNLNSVSFKDLQQQLFRTLVFQTMIPMLFMYLPVSLMFLMPWLGVELGEKGNVIAILLAIYPSLEPIVAMVFIRDFRERVMGIGKMGCGASKCTQNQLDN